MKKLPIICLLVMVFAVGTAQAQPYLYEVAPAGGKNFTTAVGIPPTATISLDIYLTGVTAPQNAGCAWLDFTGSTDDIAYVSGGRCMLDGSEGCTGPWDPRAGGIFNELGGPGTIFYIVANLGGAVPDGDGDLIVGTVTLQNTGPNDATVYIVTSAGSCWTPMSDQTVGAGVIVISQVCYCEIDAHCDDGLFCNGAETCDAPNCMCEPATNPCPTDTVCNEDTNTCDPIPATGIPTLSEWGIIIFMTIILGIGVVTLVRRRMV
jgi:hypothetical protein